MNNKKIDNRKSSSQRGYDKHWQKVRFLKLSLNPLCEECEKAGIVRGATMVHHIVPISEDSVIRLDMTNLMSLCEPCHDAKHSGAPESKQVAGCGVDGLPIHPGHPWSKKCNDINDLR